MAELKCQCGNRHLLLTEVLGDDGNPSVDGGPDIFTCPACNRVYKLVPDGTDKAKLEVVVQHSSLVAWRSL